MSEKFYNVEKILGRRKVNGKYEYKIKWEGYPISESTWEPMKNLETVRGLVEEYDSSYPISKSKSSSKASIRQNKRSFINKKRREENNQINEQINQNEKTSDGATKINDINSKVFDNNGNGNVLPNAKKKKFYIDDSLQKVVTVKQKNGLFMAVVDKLDSNGEITKASIPTEELRITNPWILLEFYESKIKFS